MAQRQLSTGMTARRRHHGTGSLTPLGADRWRSRIWLANGTRNTRTIRATTRRDAEELHRQRLHAAGLGQLATSSRTVADLLDAWLPGLALADGTIRNYRNATTKYLRPKLGPIRLDKLTGWHLTDLYRGMTPHAARNAHAALSNALEQAVKWGWLTSNPAKGNAPKKPPKRDLAPPDIAGIHEIIGAALGPDMTALLTLIAHTGMRRGEACALQWRHVDLDAGQLTVRSSLTERGAIKGTKTGEVRTIALDTSTVGFLRRHRAMQLERAMAVGAGLGATSYLFSKDPAARTPFNPAAITHRFTRLRERLGPEYARVRLHDLRHFVATELIGAGVDPRTVANRLGHKDPAMTLRVYAHARQANDQAAAEVLARRLQSPTG